MLETVKYFIFEIKYVGYDNENDNKSKLIYNFYIDILIPKH